MADSTALLDRPPFVTSASVGDPSRFVPFDALVDALRTRPAPPTTHGTLAALVRRAGEDGRREYPQRSLLTPEDGLPGDKWGRGKRKLDAQLTVMDHGVATLIANGQPLGLFGDQLYLDLDLSRANLPHGSRVRIGAAELVVTPEPHDGCRKFLDRFGKDALRFTASPDLRPLNLRGIHLRVARAGEVALGDPVEVLSRG